MSTINIRESLRQLDDDSFCKYDLLTMYDSCPLLDEDKQEIAKLLYDKEDPEVIYQKLCAYFCDDDVSSIDEINDIPVSSNFETIVTECLSKLKETYDDAKYNDVANQIEVLSKGDVYTTGLSPVDYDFADIEVFVDGNYDEPMSFDSIEDAVGYIINTVDSKISTTPVTEDDDDVMIYTVYDIVEDDDRLTAKCMNESTNDFQDIKLGKINSQKVNELLNNMLNNPNYKITDEVKKKIYDKSAPWGLAVQMVPSVDVDGTNGLLSTGDFGGEASFGESIETNFEKDDRVTDGSREGTVLDSDSQKVLVEWDYSETDDIEWVDKSDLSFVECLKESEIPMDTVMKDIQSYLNYHLGSNEDYIKVTNVTNVDKNTVAAEYEVHLSIPTGNDEYERDTEYRSLPFRYKDGKWQPVVTESKYDVKTKTNARKLVDKAKADGKKLSMKDAEEIVDQSFNDRVDTIDGLYKSLDFNESNEDDFEPQLPTFDELRKQYKNYTTFKDKEKNSGLIRDLCDQLENKKVSYDIYNHKKDSGMTIFYDDCELVEALAPYKKEEFKKQLQDELYDKFVDLARTPEWGFENLAEIGDYLMPTIEVNDYEGEYDNDIEVEFRAEVNYREMEDVCNTLDKVVKKYDKNAYFEPVQPGIAVAYLKLKDSIHESKGPKANKLRELIDDGIVSKDFIVDEFINYLSEEDIQDFLSEYDLVNESVEDVKNDVSGRYDEAAEHLMDIIYNEISAEVIDYYIDNSGSSFIITYNNNLDNIRNEAINLSDILTKNGYKVRDWATNGDNVVILRFSKPISLNEGIEDNDELISAEQEFDSAATSINSNKLPAVYSMVRFNPGDVVVDFGGGKFDNAVNYLKDQDVTLLVYDPYNRSSEHNKEVLKVLREHGGADAAVNSNVLNVIKEPEARNAVLQNIKKITKKGAPIYITVYEGTGKGNEGPTKSGYQLNRKTADYMDEIGRVFSNVKRKGKLITAINESYSSSDLRQANVDAIEYFIEFEDIYPFPKEKFLASSWKDLRDGVAMGMDDDLEIAEGIMQYLQKEIDFNNRHKEIYEDDPQAELTLEIYNKVKRGYEKEISKYESISSKVMNEASYGGAFDIEDDQYFTKEEIVEVAEKVCEHLDETYPDKFDVSDVYMETPTIIHVEVISKEGNWASANAKIDMRKIKKPSDIMKYDVVIGDLVYILRQKLEDLYEDEYMRESFTNDKLSRELQTYLQRLFEDYVEVESVKYFESPFGEESYTAEINVSELVDNYIDKRFTPLTYKLKEDGYLYVNKYSDIIVDVNGYESGVTLDCYSDVPYDVDMEQLDKEADIIGDKIIDVIQSHEEDIYNILRQELEELYVDEEDM